MDDLFDVDNQIKKIPYALIPYETSSNMDSIG